jgi:ornithine cyclodeaminase
MSLKLLSLDEVKQCITMKQAIDAMEKAFIQLAENKVQLPLRTGIPVEDENALTLAMPGYLASDKVLGLKLVSIFPNNLLKDKPSITGCILLLDASTGEAKVLMDAAYLTALRTGAVSGLATKYFAREDASHVAIIGSGIQAITQLEAVAAVRTIKQVSVWSRSQDNAAIFAMKFASQFDIQVCSSIKLAVKDADIICTATSSTEPLIHLNEIKPDAHINAIGSHTKDMKEVANSVLSKAVVVVDQLGAALAEAGEIVSAVEAGDLDKNSIIEIGNWLLKRDVDYKSKLTAFKSVGLAIQDLSVAEVVYQNAVQKQLGTTFSLS